MEELHPIPLDCRRHEALLRIIQSIESLDRICTTVCEGVVTRLREVNERVDSIQRRQQQVTKAIEILNKSNRAIVLFAPAKYPFDAPSLAATPTLVSRLEKHADDLNDLPAITGLYSQELDGRAAIRTRQLYYNVRVRPVTSEAEDARSLARVRHAGDMLLHNTSHNMYDRARAEHERTTAWRRYGRYDAVDPLAANTTRIRVATNTELARRAHNELMSAPKSLMNYDEDGRMEEAAFAYRPDMDPAAQFAALPDFLPQLAGIVEDEMMGSDEHSGGVYTSATVDIGPPLSAATLAALPDLPAATAVTASNVPPPPPPPPLPPMMSAHTSSSSHIPPAPPPPPPMIANVKAVPNDTRSSLMEAIRAAGGAEKFKSNTVEEAYRERKLAARRQQDAAQTGDGGVQTASGDNQETTAKGGANLMDELARITGRTQDEPAAAAVGARKTLTGPLARLSEMIPPPPVTTGSDDSGSDDDADWVAD